MTKVLIESQDSTQETLNNFFKGQFGHQNKDLSGQWEDTPSLTVVTDFTKEELAFLLNIPKGKILDSKRLRISDSLIFAVQDETLLKPELKSIIKSEPRTTKTEVKVMSSKSPQSYQVPKWEPGYEGLRNFLDQLDVCKSLNIFESDADLIYSSLCRSDRPELYSQLPKEEKESLEKFAKFINKTFGPSLHERKRRFNLLTQKEEEDEQQWFLRIIREYFAAKGLAVPPESEFSAEHKSDITLSFIAGLKKPELKRLMKLRLDDFDENENFSSMGKIAQRKALSLRELDNAVYTVNGHSQIFKIDQDVDQDRQINLNDRIEELQEEIKRIQSSLYN